MSTNVISDMLRQKAHQKVKESCWVVVLKILIREGPFHVNKGKVQNPYSSVDCKRSGATPRGGTSVRSRSKSVRNRATTRQYACSPLARQAFRRPRILLRAGQRSRATIDQRREEYHLQDRRFRTSCRSRAIHQSSASLSQDTLRKEAEQTPRELVQPASSSSSSSVSERSDELASRRLVPFPKMHNQNQKRRDRKDSKGLLADLPDWLQDFKENLKETELHASAHSSPESDPEHPAKVATKSRKHCIHNHFPKDWNCEVCLRTKMAH